MVGMANFGWALRFCEGRPSDNASRKLTCVVDLKIGLGGCRFILNTSSRRSLRGAGCFLMRFSNGRFGAAGLWAGGIIGLAIVADTGGRGWGESGRGRFVKGVAWTSWCLMARAVPLAAED